MSRPRRSVPKGFSALGGWAGIPVASGSCGAISGAMTAMMPMTSRKARAIFEPSVSDLKRAPESLRRATSLLRGAMMVICYTVLIRGLISR